MALVRTDRPHWIPASRDYGRMSDIEFELHASGRRPAWRLAQAERDGTRRGYAAAPAGYGRALGACLWMDGPPEVIGVRGPLATTLFRAGYALAEDMRAWAARYGMAGLDAYGLAPTAPLSAVPRVPFFVAREHMPPGREVRERYPCMIRYVAPEGGEDEPPQP